MGRTKQRDMTAEEHKAATVQYLRDCAATCMSDTARPYVAPPPRHHHLKYDPPRAPMFASAAGTRLLLTLLPGLAAKFDRVVPGSHRTTLGDGQAVACSCGGEPGNGSITPVTPNTIVSCEDECGRYFLLTGDDVLLVARFPSSECDESEPVAA